MKNKFAIGCVIGFALISGIMAILLNKTLNSFLFWNTAFILATYFIVQLENYSKKLKEKKQ